MKQLVSIILVAVCLSFAVPAISMAGDEPVRVAAAAVATVNINAATVKELQGLPGIGKVTADHIVAYRTEKGPFAAVDDLIKVKGIGKKTLEAIRDLVAVE